MVVSLGGSARVRCGTRDARVRSSCTPTGRQCRAPWLRQQPPPWWGAGPSTPTSSAGIADRRNPLVRGLLVELPLSCVVRISVTAACPRAAGSGFRGQFRVSRCRAARSIGARRVRSCADRGRCVVAPFGPDSVARAVRSPDRTRCGLAAPMTGHRCRGPGAYAPASAAGTPTIAVRNLGRSTRGHAAPTSRHAGTTMHPRP